MVAPSLQSLHNAPPIAKTLNSSFQCGGIRRDLHSFPTRRSSDLTEWRRSQADDCSSGNRNGSSRLTTWWWLTRELPDRKSTRLNSSHLGISYAVFCLKKKKIMPQAPAALDRQFHRRSRYPTTGSI